MSDLLRRLADSWNDEVGYRTRPVAWGNEIAKFQFWSAQAALLELLAEHRYVAVHSCHDSGKTLSAAVAGTWWLDTRTHPLGTAFLVSTAPTQMQVSSILWREMIKIHERARLPGRINRAGYPRWYIGTREVGYGRKPSEYESSTFQGLHEKYPLVVIDEAGGISKKLFDDVDTLVTNQNGKVLAIGNPDDPASHFAEVCGADSDWAVLHIDGLRTPNMTAEAMAKFPLLGALMEAEGIPPSTEQITQVLKDALLGANWVEERLRRWVGLRPEQEQQFGTHGEWLDYVRRRCAGSPIFQAKVRGVFAAAAQANKVVPLGWVELAVARWRDWEAAGQPQQRGRRMLGVDPARYGDDETIIAPRTGVVSEQLISLPQADTMETANNVALHMHTAQSLAIVDDIGIGAGVIDRLREMKYTGLIQGESEPFTASKNSGRHDASGEYKFRNDRAAAWWRMRELLDPSKGSRVALPPDEQLKAELTSVEYKTKTGGVIAVEPKEDVRRRLGRSTDRADAVIQSYWIDGIAVNATPEDAVAPPNGADGRWTDEQTTSIVRPSGWTAWDIDDDAAEGRWDLVTK